LTDIFIQNSVLVRQKLKQIADEKINYSMFSTRSCKKT